MFLFSQSTSWISLDTPTSSQASDPLEKAFCEDDSQSSQADGLPPLIFLTLGSHYQLIDSLETLQPGFIILYHTDLGSFRLIESHKAHHPGVSLTIYALTYPNSTEEERYLSAMQNEQLSMESLIKELGTLLINTEYDTTRETASNLREIALKNDSRLAKKKDDVDQQLQPMVVIDVREFQSELPIVLYQNGIDLYPCTLEVGDYILSPTICVERKALDDLAQSLNNGRVFKQIEQMHQHYDRIILLIESSEKFRKKRVNGGPFQGELSKRSADTRSLLCQLIRSQPKLTCLWSLSPSHSAELFEEIKLDQENPDPEKAMAIKTDDFSILEEDDIDDTSEVAIKQAKFNQTTRRSLQTLPDINMGDLDKCLRSNKFRNVQEFCCGSAEAYIKSGFTEKQADEFIQLFNTDFRLVDG
ncbi:unnamed protein product [Bursaphelenchus xylophilus]|uniref:DNA repair endonuclease XPF n=1 Tax=Bursaphelenchus xylophilus TaxID=6326 RepID=A0A1I7SX16_BURXY|nr:unnamed protein product [Bursaphelenchus xylophilus]CAG9100112.1 unnamed protein product [Bursaphelenchus xylophilus]